MGPESFSCPERASQTSRSLDGGPPCLRLPAQQQTPAMTGGDTSPQGSSAPLGHNPMWSCSQLLQPRSPGWEAPQSFPPPCPPPSPSPSLAGRRQPASEGGQSPSIWVMHPGHSALRETVSGAARPTRGEGRTAAWVGVRSTFELRPQERTASRSLPATKNVHHVSPHGQPFFKRGNRLASLQGLRARGAALKGAFCSVTRPAAPDLGGRGGLGTGAGAVPAPGPRCG